MEYLIKFPFPNPLPKLTQILYNGNEICSGPPEVPSYNTVITTINLEHTFKTELLADYYGQQANQPGQVNRPNVLQSPQPEYVAPQQPQYVAPPPSQRPPIAQQPQYVQPQRPQYVEPHPTYAPSPRPTPPRPTSAPSSSLDDLLYDR